jgi:alcohol dehydrogenase
MLEMIRSGKLKPQKLIGRTVSLNESLRELEEMNKFTRIGVTVIDRFKK